MSFDAFETSQDSGEPIELYTINVGADSFRFTSTEDDYVFNSQTFTAIPIQRAAIQMSAEIRQDTLSIEMPGTEALPQLYVEIVPSQTATLTVQRLHRTDGGTPEAILLYKGIIRSVAFSDDGQKATLSAVPISNQLTRTIPRYSYQGLCNHFLYDSRCKILKSNFQHTGEVTLVDNFNLTIDSLSSKGSDWAVGGVVQIGSSDFRGILQQSGDVITVTVPFAVDLTGVVVDVFAGCDHTIATCKSKFDNVINYGGSAYVPLKNIFQTGIK